MHPSATVGEPVKGNSMRFEAVLVLHRRRLDEGHHLTSFDDSARAFARVGSRAPYVTGVAPRVEASEEERLHRGFNYQYQSPIYRDNKTKRKGK